MRRESLICTEMSGSLMHFRAIRHTGFADIGLAAPGFVPRHFVAHGHTLHTERFVQPEGWWTPGMSLDLAPVLAVRAAP